MTEEPKGNIDLRYQRKNRSLGVPSGKDSTPRHVNLDCEFCGKSRILSPEEQQQYIDRIKRPVDFVCIECSCGRTQWILTYQHLKRFNARKDGIAKSSLQE